jgi:DNA-binding NarL/FixJ family response regulator
MTARWSPPLRRDTPSEAFLTPGQARVLTRLCYGLTNQQIAHGLHVTTNTINTHLRGIYKALGVNDRTAAVAVALSGRTAINVRAHHVNPDTWTRGA